MANAETIEDVFDDVLSDEQKKEAADLDNQQEETTEEKPAPSGYMGKEAWTASGKDPDLWVSEDVFKERTLRIKNESRLKRELAESRKDFDNRLKNVNTLQQAQLARQRAELLEQRDDAIDVADKSAVKKLDKQIADLDAEAELVKDAPVKQANPPEVDEWEEENPWVNDVNDPRTPIAQAAYGEAIASGKTLAYALRAADKAVAAMKPTIKADDIRKKPAVSMSDSSRAATTDSNSLTLSWSQLTSEDKAIYEELFSHKSQKDYLKIVADARTGAKK